ncbi:MAG: hypothetical protein QXX99_04630 [Candidatus Bathyarchaeia archaeon]
MSSEFEVWFLPHNLRSAYERAALLLKSVDFDALYLPIPHELDWLINDLAFGAPYEQFMEEVKRLSILREPISSWEYRFKPILLTVRGLKLRKPNLKIVCYRDSFFDNLSTKDAEKIAALTLRVNVTGKVDAEEWRDIILRIIGNLSSSAINEGDYILKTWIKDGEWKTVCLSDHAAKGLVKSMRKYGIKAALRYIFTPYHFTPLEVLIREFIVADERGSNIGDERVKMLVKMHVEFIRDYILTSSNYDEAYFRWLRNGNYKKYLG